MGRTKVDIKKIEDRARRQTTFTKRRQGLFKKAGELSTKCDSEVAVIAFSMAGNAYAYGHPNVDSVLKRYDDAKASGNNDGNPVLEKGEELEEVDGEYKEVEEEYKEAVARLGVEKSVGEIVETVVQSGPGKGKLVWNEAIEDLGLAELEQLDSTMEEMKNKVVERMVGYSTSRDDGI